MPLDDTWRPRARVLAEVLDGGQSFRWVRQGRDAWWGVFSHHSVILHLPSDGSPLSWKAHTPATTEGDVRHYLGMDDDWAARHRQLPPADPVLATARASFPDLRILRQDVGEVLLTFLCSATKQIAQIRQMAELLASRFGSPLPGGRHALPTWESLADVPEADLRACQLGFRARHVAATARALAQQPGWRRALEILSYPQAHAWLLSLPGVGPKIADCVQLFGLAHHQAFPVDTWILRCLAHRYGLDGWRLDQVAHFGRVHFAGEAGLAQQYLFAFERATAGSPSGAPHHLLEG